LIEVDLGPRKDTFGFQSFLSFLDHVDCYQHVQHLQHGKDIIKFKFVNNGVPVYDIFEFYSNCDTIFQDTNIIVVETLNQFLNIVNKLDLTKKYIIFSESYWDVKKYDLNLDNIIVYDILAKRYCKTPIEILASDGQYTEMDSFIFNTFIATNAIKFENEETKKAMAKLKK
jgi:hypothetical protein